MGTGRDAHLNGVVVSLTLVSGDVIASGDGGEFGPEDVTEPRLPRTLVLTFFEPIPSQSSQQSH